MNMTDVATWGQLISSAAVLVTLVYLSIQTKQTATLLRSEARQSLIEQDMQILRTQVDIPELVIHMTTEDELTLEQKYRLQAYLMEFTRTREHQWLQYQSGVLDRDTYAAYQRPIAAVLGPKRCRAWWTTLGRTLCDPAFANEVDAFLEGQPDSIPYHQQMLVWN